MFGQKNWLVILVSTGTLQVVGQKDSSVATLTLPESIISHMEVINKDALYQLITDWLKLRTYTNTEIIWLLSGELCFDHVLTSLDQDKLDSEIVDFLDTIPFEEVASRTYLFGAERRLVATSSALLSALIQSFSLHGYSTRAVVPASLLTASRTLTMDLAHQVYKKSNELEALSLIASPPPVSPPQVILSKPKSSLPLLLSIFGVLLAILGFVLYLN